MYLDFAALLLAEEQSEVPRRAFHNDWKIYEISKIYRISPLQFAKHSLVTRFSHFEYAGHCNV